MDDRSSKARWIVLLVATVLALYVCWLMLKPLLNVLAWATVLVILFYPVHRRIVAATRRPTWSALVSCVLVVLTILLPFALVIFAVLNELSGAVKVLQSYAMSLLDANSPITGPMLRYLGRFVDIEQLRAQALSTERIQTTAGALAGRTLGVLGGAFGIVVDTFFTVFTMYYLFRDGNRILRALRDFLPLNRTQADAIFERTREVINACLYGVLVIGIIQGALGGLAFWALGLPSAIVWAVVMAVLSMIPMAGAFIVWVPAAVFLAVTGHWVKAALLTAWGALVIGTVDNFLRPKLVGEKTRLHELFVFFSVLGGLSLFGVLGIVLGPVILAVTLALLEIAREANIPVGQERVFGGPVHQPTSTD
ncbi:MAG: hypothetical protein C4334_08265 [Pyrinomonas sp.]|uniref:AI-2E family transporter n=1 Tax=Pyrinomonas sp. TaxID=2080306 RepID=UPI003324DE02